MHHLQALIKPAKSLICTDSCTGNCNEECSASIYKHQCGGTFTCLDANAKWTTCDGGSQQAVDPSDMASPGKYAVKYSCTDGHNVISRCRTVVTIDTRTSAPTPMPTAACTPGHYSLMFSHGRLAGLNPARRLGEDEDPLPGLNPTSDSVECTPCPAGKYSNTYNAGECDMCPAGKYSISGVAHCIYCRNAQYSKPGEAACTECPAGKWTVGFEKSRCVGIPTPSPTAMPTVHNQTPASNTHNRPQGGGAHITWGAVIATYNAGPTARCFYSAIYPNWYCAATRIQL